MRGHLTAVVGLAIVALALGGGSPAGAEEGTCPSAASLGFADAAAMRRETAPVTVIGQVDRAKVTKEQARRISMLNPVLSLVTLSGRTIRPLPGHSLWQLSDGAWALFDTEPDVNAMQIWTKDLGDGDLYVRACLCPNQNTNIDDGCKFSDGGNPTNPGTCGGNRCCSIVEGVILGDGTPIVF